MSRYVALGSSMAAGPGISPRAEHSPWPAMRSASNYPHLLAERRDLDLVDVTYSGATTAHVLTDSQNGTRPQIEVLDGTEELITITIGGNDIAYVPGMYVASLPRVVHWLPLVGPPMRKAIDKITREASVLQVREDLVEVGRQVRERSPNARVLFVEYLTLLPPAGVSAFPLRTKHADLARYLAAELQQATAAAAEETECEVVGVAEASAGHHAWSNAPWTVGAILPFPGRPLAYHPNLPGMHAVTELIDEHLSA